MARLEIELGAVNADLKRVLRESKIELSNFSKGLDFKTAGVNKLNTDLGKTKQLLTDITGLANRARTSLGGTVNSTAIQQERIALAQARTEAQNYRTESARLGAQMAALRAETMRNRSSITAAAGSYREAQQRLTALGRSIREAENGFRSTNPAIQSQIREYRNLNRQLQDFDSTMGNNQRRVGNYQRALQGLGSTIGSFLGVTALIAAGKAVIDNNARISDSLADVRRTAGLTSKEADQLTTSLKALGTRTGLNDLLGIATIGGQLGIAKDQLAGFTEAIDQLAVTLSGELQGGAEGIAKSLGVLDNVFEVSAGNAGNVNKAYNQIGSAILGLGQSGLATGDFLADFGERVGGLAKQAGISLPVLLSYGAVLQENGVSAEVAGTAFKRLLSALSSNSAGFLKVAQLADSNLTLKEFNTIINTDTKKALELFFKGLKEGGSSTVAFNSILKSLKLSGAGVSQVVAALSNNQVALNGHIKEATGDFNDASKAADQFKIKNDTLAGSIDKLGNTFVNYTSSGTIGRFFKSIIDGLNTSLSEFGKLVNSSSWKEFFSRLANNNGNVFEVNASVASLTKRTNDNQRFLYPQGGSPEQQEKKLAAIGQKGFNDYLSALKKTADESKATLDRFAAGVKSGDLKDLGGKGGIVDFTQTYNKAKTYYEDLLALQKKLGFTPKQKDTTRSNAETPEGFAKGTKTKVVELKDIVGELNKALELTEVQFLDTFGERNQGKISAYQSAINAATNAFGRQSDAVKDLQKEQLKLYQLPSIASNISANTGIQNPTLDSEGKSKLEVDLKTKQKPESLINKEAQEEARMFKKELSRTVARFSEDLYQSLIDINTKGYKNFGEGLAGVAGDLAKSLTDSIGNVFMTAFSNQLTNVFEKAIGNLSAGEQAMAGAAVLLGSVVSGLFPKTSSGGQALGGALKGAGTGAVIGSIVPGIGTAIGAVAGGIIGAIGGLFGAKKARKEEARRQAELEEQKKQTALLERANALAYTASIIGRKTVNGVVTGVEVNEFGQITAKVSGNDLAILLERANRSRQRGV